MPAWYQRTAWSLLRHVRGPELRKKYNVRTEFLDPEPRRPYVLLANHAHVLDPWILGTLLDSTIRYMANLEGTHPFKALFANIVGAYGKRKGAPDFVSLRKTLSLGKAGETLGIFPEGDRSWDGAPLPIRPGLGRLLRMLGMPVFLARQEGSYLSGPRWAAFPRRGRWTVTFRALSRERVADSSPRDLEDVVRTFLQTDDMRNPSLRHVSFECPAPAEGIERLLWLCPVCGESDTISGVEDRIACASCGSSWITDGNQRIECGGGRAASVPFEDIRGWSDLQRTVLARRIGWSEPLELRDPGEAVSTEALCQKEGAIDDKRRMPALVSDGVRLLRKVGRSIVALGRGRLTLFRDALAFHAEDGGRPLVFHAGKVRYFVDNFNAYSEFSYGQERYRLLFGGGNSMKWIHALEILQSDGGISI